MSDFDDNDVAERERSMLQRDDSMASFSSVGSSILAKGDSNVVLLNNSVKMPTLGCTSCCRYTLSCTFLAM